MGANYSRFDDIEELLKTPEYTVLDNLVNDMETHTLTMEIGVAISPHDEEDMSPMWQAVKKLQELVKKGKLTKKDELLDTIITLVSDKNYKMRDIDIFDVTVRKSQFSVDVGLKVNFKRYSGPFNEWSIAYFNNKIKRHYYPSTYAENVAGMDFITELDTLDVKLCAVDTDNDDEDE